MSGSDNEVVPRPQTQTRVQAKKKRKIASSQFSPSVSIPFEFGLLSSGEERVNFLLFPSKPPLWMYHQGAQNLLFEIAVSGGITTLQRLQTIIRALPDPMREIVLSDAEMHLIIKHQRSLGHYIMLREEDLKTKNRAIRIYLELMIDLPKGMQNILLNRENEIDQFTIHELILRDADAANLCSYLACFNILPTQQIHFSLHSDEEIAQRQEEVCDFIKSLIISEFKSTLLTLACLSDTPLNRFLSEQQVKELADLKTIEDSARAGFHALRVCLDVSADNNSSAPANDDDETPTP